LSEAQQRARELGAMDALDRRQKAAGELARITEEKRTRRETPKQRARTPHVSTTDPQTRVMRVSNGGMAPAYNVQLAVMGDPTGGPVAIVAIEVTQRGNDKKQLMPMRTKVEANLGTPVKSVLVDSDFLSIEELQAAEQTGYEVIAPKPARWGKGETRRHDAVFEAWMAKESEPAIQERYRGRKALVERMNARVLTVGVGQLPVRGVAKVRTFMTLVAVAITLFELGPRWLGWPKILPSGVTSSEAPPLVSTVPDG
jgi:hypothetical protein